MTEIQEKLLNILRAFDTICRKYDAEYFLTGGSALGAIRHNGFIPWDDDIDLGLTRPMWEKVRPHLETELPDGLVMGTVSAQQGVQQEPRAPGWGLQPRTPGG